MKKQKNSMKYVFATMAGALALVALQCRAADVFVECESFAELGGWVVDA